jgi:hypothetical protein
MAAPGAAAPSSRTLLLRPASGWSLRIESSPLQLNTSVLFGSLSRNQHPISCALFGGLSGFPGRSAKTPTRTFPFLRFRRPQAPALLFAAKGFADLNAQTDDLWITGEQGIYNQGGCAFPLIDRSLGKSNEPTMFADRFLRGI